MMDDNTVNTGVAVVLRRQMKQAKRNHMEHILSSLKA
jgi:hypothetical protein